MSSTSRPRPVTFGRTCGQRHRGKRSGRHLDGCTAWTEERASITSQRCHRQVFRTALPVCNNGALTALSVFPLSSLLYVLPFAHQLTGAFVAFLLQVRLSPISMNLLNTGNGKSNSATSMRCEWSGLRRYQHGPASWSQLRRSICGSVLTPVWL